jgi:electron transfer flavoprotein beta subunit
MPMRVAVALKWVDRRPEVDPTTGAVHDDDRFSGASEADRAALEWALRAGETWGADVMAVAAGPGAADAVLREALACGASAAVRVDLDRRANSAVVAEALATVVDHAAVVWCGDYSLDRGSGSVPAFLAARLGAAQALGLVGVELGADPGTLVATRRLDGGRRERLRVLAPAVVSVEGATARLRRASLAATLTARKAAIDVRPGPRVPEAMPAPTRPYRPRPRVLPAPAGEDPLRRIQALTMGAAPKGSGQAVVLDPGAAAERILAALAEWGYDLPAP